MASHLSLFLNQPTILNIEVKDEPVTGKVGPIAGIHVGRKMIVGPSVMFLLIKDHDVVCYQSVRFLLYEPADPLNDVRVAGDEPGVTSLVDDLTVLAVPEHIQKGIVMSDTSEALHLVLVEKHRMGLDTQGRPCHVFTW